MAKVLVCGSRSITDRSAIKDAMFRHPEPFDELISGGATGVDSISAWIAKEAGIPVRIFKPDWDTHGRGAGIIRNRQMVDEADIVIAIWDRESRGTKFTIEYALKQGKPTLVTYHDLNPNANMPTQPNEHDPNS